MVTHNGMLQHFFVLNAQEKVSQLYSNYTLKKNPDMIKILNLLNQGFNGGLHNIGLKMLKYTDCYMILSEISGT